MDWLSVGIHTLGMYETTGDWLEDALNLIAQIRLMGLIFRYRDGRETDIPGDDVSQTLVDRFVNTLDLENVDKAKMARVVSTYLVLHMDHGGGNLSTFTGKSIASGKATIYSAIAGAMNALSGPLHGRANQSCLGLFSKLALVMRMRLKSLCAMNWRKVDQCLVLVMQC